jgi:hypothetical protein
MNVGLMSSNHKCLLLTKLETAKISRTDECIIHTALAQYVQFSRLQSFLQSSSFRNNSRYHCIGQTIEKFYNLIFRVS